MRIGQLVGRQAPHVPQEPVGDILAADHHAVVNGQERQGVVTVTLPEVGQESIRKVLPSLLVAVGHHHAERPAVFGRDAAEHLTDKGVEMVLQVGRGHLVHFEPGAFGRRGRILDAGRAHPGTHDDPLPGRGFPHQAVAVETFRYVDHLRGVDRQRGIVQHGLVAPLVLLPVGQRRLEHLGKGLLRITLHTGQRRELHFRETRILPRTADYEPELAPRGFRHADRNRGVRVETDLDIGVRAVDPERCDCPVAVRPLHLQFGLGTYRTAGGPHRDVAQIQVGVRHQVDDGFGAAVEEELRRRVAVYEALRPGSRAGSRHTRIGRRQRRTPHGGSGIGDHPHVLEIGRRARQLHLDLPAAPDMRLDRSQVTHGLPGFDPRPSGLAPAGAVEHADLDTQPRGAFERRMGHFPPFVRKEFHGGIGRRQLPEADIADEGTVDPRPFHRFEVFHHALLRDIARKPVPVNRGLDRVGRRHEPRGQGGMGAALRGGLPRQRSEGQRQHQNQFR